MYHILIFFEKLKERKKKCDRLEEVGDVWGNDESSSFKKLKQKWMNEWMFGAQTNSSLSWKKRKFSCLIKMEEKKQNMRRCNIFLAFYLYSTTRPMYKFCFFFLMNFVLRKMYIKSSLTHIHFIDVSGVEIFSIFS